MLTSIASILPPNLYAIVSQIPESILATMEELRVRENRPLEVVYQGKFGFVAPNGAVAAVDRTNLAYRPTHADCMQLLDLLANHSLYTMEEELKRGYVTVRGGHRVGLAGTAIVEGGAVRQLKTISSFNIRLAREVRDAGKFLLGYLLDPAMQSVHHTLIISPPQQGKTTIARDLSRMISYGHWPVMHAHWKGLKVGIVDERSELAACHQGVPTFDVGPRTDVLDSCPKAEGMMMMIRSMSPDVIIVDEIGREEDAHAIQEAIHAGIRVIATAHGHSLSDMMRRPMLKTLIEEQAFSRFAVLDRTLGANSVKSVFNGNGEMLYASQSKNVKSHHG